MRSFFIIMLFAQLYMGVCIVSICGKHLLDRITSLKWQVWAHQANLIPPLFIEVHVTNQKSKRWCICVLEESILPLSTILIFDFGIDPTVWFVIFHLFKKLSHYWMISGLQDLSSSCKNISEWYIYRGDVLTCKWSGHIFE